jgi:RNA polymerase sigma factor (sigma-70 family)
MTTKMTTMTPSKPTTAQPFQAFLDEHRSPVLAYLRATVGQDAAEDCFQETFMAALRNYEGLDAESPRAWLLTIARNKAIDHFRARKRAPIPSDPVPDPVDTATPARPEDPDPVLWRQVGELPEKQRSAIALRFVSDMRFRDVGLAMGTSEEAARRNVHEGLKKLRRGLEAKERES